MTAPPLLESELGKLYSTYYPRKDVNTQELLASAGNVKSWQAALKRWWEGTNNQGQYRTKAGNITLDIGCGSGLSLLEAKALGADAYGIEADPNVQRIAEELNLNIHIGSLHDEPFPGISFDLIILNQVIEHIPEPGKALDALRKRLRPGGRIVLVFPNRRSLWQQISREHWINWHIPYHLHHFDTIAFKAFAEKYGYRIIRQTTITPNIWTVLQLRALREKPIQGTPSSNWRVDTPVPQTPPPQLPTSPANPSLLKYIKRAAKTAIFTGLAITNRSIDRLGMGDSILVELEAI